MSRGYLDQYMYKLYQRKVQAVIAKRQQEFFIVERIFCAAAPN
jgi:hypothetical protein